jgi:YidC/Oxa1 family membrane protein insertase
VGSLIPLTTELTLLQAMRKTAGISLIMNVVYLFVLWSSPIALGLYYTASGIFALAEKLFYRTKWGQQLLHRGIEAQAIAA